jgi:hypothetical protein
VAPCTVLGVCRTGPAAGATARRLAGAEASRAAEQLAPKHPAWRGVLSSLAHRVTGRRAVFYELRPDETEEEPAAPPAATAQVRKRDPVRLVPAGDGRRPGRWSRSGASRLWLARPAS